MSWLNPRRDRTKPRSSAFRIAWITFCVLGWILLLLTIWSFYRAQR